MWARPCRKLAVLEANANGGSAEVGNPVPDGASFRTVRGNHRRASAKLRRHARRAGNSGLSQGLAAVVLIRTKGGSRSGRVLQNGLSSPTGLVEASATSRSSSNPAATNQVTESTEFLSGKVKYVDRSATCHLIEVDNLPRDVKCLKICANDDLESRGCPMRFGHPARLSWTFTQGVSSSIRRSRTETQNYTAVQTQTPINPGNCRISRAETAKFKPWAVAQ